MTDAEEVTTTKEAKNLAGKYLTFSLAGENYGLVILTVREIIGMLEITRVPMSPHHVRGVINLRGRVIPVIDLRLCFGLPFAETTEETCIIVVAVEGVEMGIIVDKVCEVLDIAGENIEEAPAFGMSVDTSFILGLGKSADRVTILLDIAKVINEKGMAI